MAALNTAIDAVSASDKASAAPVMEVIRELENEIEGLIKK